MRRVFRLRYDIRLMYRDPIMVLFAILPLFLMMLFRFGLPFAGKILMDRTGFDLFQYNTYIFAMALIMTPYMTGTLAGFLMLDEKDGNILELVLVTPPGFSGYIFGRLLSPLLLSLTYTLIGFALFHGYYQSVWIIPGTVVIIMMECVMTAMLLFAIAENKVQGLTVSKGLGILIFPVFFGLLDNAFLDLLGYFTPYYWVRAYLASGNIRVLVSGILVNSAWLLALIFISFNRTFKKHSFHR